MKARRTIALPAAILSLLLFATLAHGQGRGMRGPSSGYRSGFSLRPNRSGDLDRRGGRGFANGFGFPFAPFFYPDYYAGGDGNYTSTMTEEEPVQARAVQPQPPAPPPPPGDPLILENQDGKWVRIPTGAEMLKAAAPLKAETSAPANSPMVIAEPAITEVPLPALPPAVLVFRDGHSEEIQRYMIQGANLYATAAYSTTGSWTEKIPLADLDIPASLKINKDRGTKFHLPSGPNEVVVRF